MTTLRCALALLLLTFAACTDVPLADRPDIPSTFSIAAIDSKTGEIGVAVQSKFLAVGAVVPWARAKVGAIATQAYANTTFGPEGLALLEKGVAPDEVLAKLLGADPGRESRQVGIVSASGLSAGFTGKECNEWAGGVKGPGFCVQGNILASQAVVKAMARVFQETKGELAERLLAALEAGQDAGGDRRGQQSAALLVVHEGWGFGGYDHYRDVRVDDSKEPIAELRRLYVLQSKIFPRPKK
jgi:uncharacterized Ntn-hydrolase superfamily protein